MSISPSELASKNYKKETLAKLRPILFEYESLLIDASHRIHELAELSFAEYQSSALLIKVLEENEFKVTKNVANLDTAFVAEYGEGEIQLAILAEYDALPDIGHACGHNIIATASLGAALILKRVIDPKKFKICLFGTPAEESGGGKVLMLEHGAFGDSIAAIMVHPSNVDTAPTYTRALIDWRIIFKGKSSHASAKPQAGINALDAANISQVALGFLRQQLPRGLQYHGIVTEGGSAPNIIPERVVLHYYIRAESREEIESLVKRVENCFAAGALATGCDYEIEEVTPPLYEVKNNPTLIHLYEDIITDIGRQPIPIGATIPPIGSTDMGNVSHEFPALHAIVAVGDGKANVHERDFTKAVASGSGDKAVLDSALALATVGLTVLESPDIQAQLRADKKALLG